MTYFLAIIGLSLVWFWVGHTCGVRKGKGKTMDFYLQLLKSSDKEDQ